MGTKSPKITHFFKCLGYEFKNHDILKQALTHRSASTMNNERYEFLGDAILSLIISNFLFEHFPNKSEGQLSRLRAHLVKGETLASIARELNLGDHLKLGQGELKSGGFRRASILADAFEALIAGIYFDSDMATTKKVLLKLYNSRLHDEDLLTDLKDAKTKLQEWLQSRKYPLPVYQLLKTEGEEHCQVFYVQCYHETLQKKAQGQGKSRRQAEQIAAEKLLKQL